MPKVLLRNLDFLIGALEQATAGTKIIDVFSLELVREIGDAAEALGLPRFIQRGTTESPEEMKITLAWEAPFGGRAGGSVITIVGKTPIGIDPFGHPLVNTRDFHLTRNMAEEYTRILKDWKRFINLSTAPANEGKAGKGDREGEWLTPTSKADMANRLGNVGVRKVTSMLRSFGLKQAGNRQLWTVRLDTMPINLRRKLEQAK